MIQGKDVDCKESIKIFSQNPNSKELSHHKEKPKFSQSKLPQLELYYLTKPMLRHKTCVCVCVYISVEHNCGIQVGLF